MLDELLRSRGAIPVSYPCIAISLPAETSALDRALAELALGDFDWLLLTSANTVDKVAERLAVLGATLHGTSTRVAAVGPATADAAARLLGAESVRLPEEYVAEALAASLPLEPGARVFLPESAIARPTLKRLLAERGAQVTAVVAYETACGAGGAEIATLLAAGQVDALTFTSSSTVSCFAERLANDGGRSEDALPLPAVCIGEKSAATAREAGFASVFVAAESTIAGLVEALEKIFRAHAPQPRVHP